MEKSDSDLGEGAGENVYAWLTKIKFYMLSYKIVSTTSHEDTEERTKKRKEIENFSLAL